MFDIFNLVIIRIKLLVNKSFIVSILVVPIFIFLITSTVDLNKQQKINIGIGYETDEIKKLLDSRINTYIDDSFNLIIFNNEEDLKASVETYKTDCGYFITSKYVNKYAKSINLYKTETTTSDKVLNIFLASILVLDRSGELGVKVLEKYIDNKDIAKETIQQDAKVYTKDGALMDISYDTKNYKTNTSKTNLINFDNLFYSIYGIIILFVCILNIEQIIEEKNSNIILRLKNIKNGISKYFGSYLIAQSIIIFVYLTISHLVLNVFYKTSYSNYGIVIICDILLSFVISSFCIMISIIFKSNKYILVLAVYSFISSLLFSGAILPIKNVISNLDILKYFTFNYYYLLGLNSVSLIMIGIILIFMYISSRCLKI